MSVLDVGCGVGGTSRYIARAIGKDSKVTGITLSPNQVKRAQELAVEQEVRVGGGETMLFLLSDIFH